MSQTEDCFLLIKDVENRGNNSICGNQEGTWHGSYIVRETWELSRAVRFTSIFKKPVATTVSGDTALLGLALSGHCPQALAFGLLATSFCPAGNNSRWRGEFSEVKTQDFCLQPVELQRTRRPCFPIGAAHTQRLLRGPVSVLIKAA